jgi:murein DD-endopeptidase MepM/ murein hydrolase activator NlpD
MPNTYNPGVGYTPTSPFAWRVDPVTRITRQYHQGQDWRADPGTEVRAASYGNVWYSGFSSSLGNTVIIDHGTNSDGARVMTLYAHLSNDQRMVAGAFVTPGTVIGLVGSTAENTGQGITRFTGPHILYETLELR